MDIRRVLPAILAFGGQMVNAAELSAPLAPSSKWQVDYGMIDCRLLRTFGEGRKMVMVQLRIEPLFLTTADKNKPSSWHLDSTEFPDAIELTLAGSQMPETARPIPVSVGTSTVTQVHGIVAQGFAPSYGAPSLIRFTRDKDLPVALRSDIAAGLPTRLTVAFAKSYSAQLDLGSLKAPLAALDACKADLMAEQTREEEERRQQRTPPEPVAPARWLKATDYPAKQLNAGFGGSVLVRLRIGTDGLVAKCEVLRAGGDKAFDALTCRLMTERGRFRPAIGKDGNPVASVWYTNAKWLTDASFFTAQ